jgi:surface antigen
LHQPAAQSVLSRRFRQALYKPWERVGISVLRPAGVATTLILIGTGSSGCSMSHVDSAFARMSDPMVTGSIGPARTSAASGPTATDLAFARTAASDVLTKGDKDSSQPWENPETGARGSVTPLAQAYTSEGRTCRDFLASYVNGHSERWLQGAACQTGRGRWEIHTLQPWKQS